MGYRYLGNKTRLLPQLTGVIAAAVKPGATIADPMCGTASVSEALALSGFRVVASDELTFPTIHARVRLLMASAPSFGELGGYERVLSTLNNLAPIEGLFWREYSPAGEPANGTSPRGYFAPANAGRIDAIRAQLLGWQVGKRISEHETYLLLHDLLLATNDVANIAGTYGYFRSGLSGNATKHLTLRPSSFVTKRNDHEVLQGKVEELAGSLVADACYLDPPYTKRQYAGNYHILETLAMQDEPEPVGEGGLRDWYGQYSNFCSKRFVKDAFSEVIKRLDVADIFISYSEDGLLPADELAALLESRGVVRRHDFPVSRFRSNSRGKSGQLAEHLYHVEVA